VWAIRGVLGGGFAVFREYVAEFRPTLAPDKRGTYPVVLFLALSALVAVLAAASLGRGKLGWFGPLTALALVYLGCSSVRFVTTAALALPVLGVALMADARLFAMTEGRASLLGAAVTAALTLAVAFNVALWGYEPPPYPLRKLGVGRDYSDVPVAAAELVRGLPLVGHIFNEHSFGAYLAWQWNGAPRIFFHGYVIDPEFYRRNYVDAMLTPEGFDRVVKDFDIDVVFIQPREGLSIYRTLSTRPDWHLVHWDQASLVYLRDRPEYASIIDKTEFRYVHPYRPNALALGMARDPARVRDEAARAVRAFPENAGLRALASDLGIAGDGDAGAPRTTAP
jgi:hypothetical protein